MTVQTVPAYLQNASHSAAVFRQAVTAPFQSPGILGVGELAVTQQSTPNMSIILGAGRAMVAGSQVTPPSGLSFTTQAMYNVLNDGSITLTVSTANATLPRIDAVYIGVQDAFYSGSSNQAVAGIVAGTASSTPVAPSIPVNSYLIAYIAVGAGVTSILNANITMQSAFAALLGGRPGLVPISSGFTVTGGTLNNDGSVTFSGTSIACDTVFTAGTFDSYRIELDQTTTNTNTNIQIIERASGTDNTSAYFWDLIFSTGSSVSAANTANASSVQLSAQAALYRHTTINVFNPAISTIRTMYAAVDASTDTTTMGQTRATGWHGVASAFDGFKISTLTGAVFTGKLRVYGVNDR